MHRKRLFAIGYGHFAIDILNSSIAIILTSLSGQFDLSVSQIGFGAMAYTFSAALTQPLFGMLADKLRGRWMGAAGLLWTIVFYSLIPLATNYWMLVTILMLAALGSAAFHPVGVVNASHAGGRRPATATSVFFLLGQTGLALGPVISGYALQHYGVAALPVIALAMTPAVLFMVAYLRQPTEAHDAHDHEERGAAVVPRKQASGFAITALILVIALRATTIQSYMTLLPKYFADLGYTGGEYGLMIGVFSMAGAIGTFSGGFLGDRMDRRWLMATAMVLSVPFSLALLNLHGAWGYFVVAAIAGALLNIPHSILLIVGQDLLPRRKGLMGGVVLGFMFASGAAMAWIASWFADIVGLGVVLTVLAFFPIAAGAFALALPKSQPIMIEIEETGPVMDESEGPPSLASHPKNGV
jgi:FSR family fosmidomycin resistance protein-like MFS transporter